MIESVEMPSDSARKFTSTRWLSTGRARASTSSTEAAKHLGVSLPAYSRYERYHAPSRQRAQRMAQATGVDLARILRVA